MKTKLLIFLALAAAVVTFTAESCFVSTKEVEVPVRGEGDLSFHASGVSDSGTRTIDFAELIDDLRNDSGFDSLLSAHIENGYWHVINNLGSPSLTVSGQIGVQEAGSAAAPVPLIAYTSIDIADYSGDFVVAPLNSAGVDMLNQGFDDYLRGTRTSLSYVFTWSSQAGAGTVNFDWEGKVKFVLVGLTTVDVPEL